jgi:1-phosphofructokinase
MIITVTPNPSLDRTLEVDRLDVGGVFRSRARRVEPGGKGINVALTLHVHGHPVSTVMPCGGAEGDQLVRLLREAGLEPVTVPIDGDVRANVAIVDADGTVTKVNEPGPEFTDEEVDALLDAVVAEMDEDTEWVVASGSLPPGAPADFFATLVHRAHDAGCRVVVDAAGAALTAAVDAGPDLVKPNREALAEVTGLPVTTIGEAVAAAEQLRERGVGAVLASLSEDGAILVDEHGALHGYASVRLSRSSVGAGNATLAGYLTGADGDRETALRLAVAFGAAAASQPGSKSPEPADLQPGQVLITNPPELHRVLRSATPTEIRVPPRSMRRTPILR